MRDESPRWQQILATGFRSGAELLDFLELPREDNSVLAETQFATRVPRGFASRMKKRDRHDPLLRQVLAIDEELQNTPGFVRDPLHEATTNFRRGLVHKYYGRVLLTVTGACAINCRYCFRRHFPYHDNNPGRGGWEEVLDYIAADQSLHEVILSGGDPLLASDATLSFLIRGIEAIPHVKTLRIHTRMAVVLPERVDESFCQLLKTTRLNRVMVLHINHPNELDEHVRAACGRLRDAGCHLLNQSVLLAEVNDDVDVLMALSERLFSYGVLPYYLHVLDKVKGAAHFDVSEVRALELFYALQHHLPGYLVPRLARELPGEKSKVLLGGRHPVV
jgi:EF-P beta-lysylation protein EpmB